MGLFEEKPRTQKNNTSEHVETMFKAPSYYLATTKQIMKMRQWLFLSWTLWKAFHTAPESSMVSPLNTFARQMARAICRGTLRSWGSATRCQMAYLGRLQQWHRSQPDLLGFASCILQEGWIQHETKHVPSKKGCACPWPAAPRSPRIWMRKNAPSKVCAHTQPSGISVAFSLELNLLTSSV